MKYLISFILVLLSFQSFAADDGDWWLQREIQLQQNREDYARRVYGSARHTYDVQITENGVSKVKTMTKNVVVEDVPSKTKVGKSLLKRAYAYKNGVAGVVLGLAVAEMIETVGWVMEDGSYVKYKKKEEDFPYIICAGSKCYKTDSFDSGASLYFNDISKDAWPGASFDGFEKTNCPYGTSDNLWCSGKIHFTFNKSSSDTSVELNRKPNPDYVPAEPNFEKVKITDKDVGGIVTGDYVDPVDEKYNIKTDDYNDLLITAYQHDPSGVGDDLANEMDDRIKNAPPTSDGKPAPIGDSRYVNPPEEDKTTNDRSWGDDANEADGDITPNTDPVTGEPTGGQSISLQFPVFCEWAHKMCKWYDDWKASDIVYKDHMKKTEEHQIEEKSFWKKVTDWFDWTKEEPEPDEEQEEPDIDDQGIFNKTFDCTSSNLI